MKEEAPSISMRFVCSIVSTASGNITSPATSPVSNGTDDSAARRLRTCAAGASTRRLSFGIVGAELSLVGFSILSIVRTFEFQATINGVEETAIVIAQFPDHDAAETMLPNISGLARE